MKYFSMFSGIGGFELGIERAFFIWHRGTKKGNEETKTFKSSLESTQKSIQSTGTCSNNIRTRNTRQIQCISFSEIDKYAIQIYKRHFPKHKNFGDATKIIPEELPDFDLLCGGFPCQSFSIAGKRKGFEDTRGTLFFDICRIARVKRPSYIFLENVRGLLSHDNGYTFLVILESLAELGYSLQWQVLNSKDFGVPQNRERVFIIGYLAKSSPPKVFPIRETIQVNNKQKEKLSMQISNTLRTNYSNGYTNETYIKEEMISPTIRAEHHNTSDVHFIPENSGIRRLTPIECERLQGFPDRWTEKGIDRNGNEVGISDTQRYKVLGNAVTVNVIKVIMTRWLGG